jgi:GMP synthase-like glutamine amidotransferase
MQESARMKIHCLQHVPFEGPGSIGRWARLPGHSLTRTRLADGERLPSTDSFDLLTIMGGPMSVHDVAAHPWIPEELRFIGQAIRDGKKILGICLGAQMIATVLGAAVRRNPEPEIGWYPVRKADDARRSELAQALPDEMDVLHWHFETFDLPRGAVHLLTSQACANQAFAYLGKVIGLQFHLEMSGDGAQDLIRYCGKDAGEGPFVQRPETILWEPQRFDRANAALDRILDHLSRAAG